MMIIAYEHVDILIAKNPLGKKAYKLWLLFGIERNDKHIYRATLLEMWW